MKQTYGKPVNPFVFQGYEGPDYFCDRQEETQTLLSHLKNGRNVTLVSPRRMGKTGLIKNTFHHLQKSDNSAVCLYIDIFSTKNLNDFVRQFGTMVINDFVTKNSSLTQKILSFFGSLRPVFSIDTLTGAPNVSITIEPAQEEITLRNVFDYLNISGKEIYIAIDEFQQIAEYPEKGTEALLRSYIQFARNVHFIFSGSKFHLMSEIFGSPKRAFYQSTELLNLKALKRDVYYDFCRNFFADKGGDLAVEVFNYVYDMFDGHTWYVQCVMNRLYEIENRVDNVDQINHSLLSIVNSREAQYETLTQFFTANQFDLLKAIAKDSIVSQPTSAKFITSHRLSGASSTKAALKVLEDKELVYRTPQGYVVYDKFMDLWLKRI